MRTAIFYGERDIRIEDIPVPRPQQGEVLIEVRASGICGSDLHRYRGHEPWGAKANGPRRHGHEIAGVVKELGPDTNGIEVGQAVAVEPMQLAGCGKCSACLRGDNNLCQQRDQCQLRRVSAGFSEFDIATINHVYPFPEDLSFEVAALADVYACAIHAIHRIPVSAANTVLILGCGPVGFALGQVARLSGAQTIMIGRCDQSLSAAMRLGAADQVINSVTSVVSEELAQRTGKRGTNVVFEAVGGTSSETLELAIDAVSPGGVIGILGAFVGDMQVPYNKANRKEIRLQWCNGYSAWKGRREFQIALDWITEARVNAAPLITHRFDLQEIAKAFETADHKSESGAIKVMLKPNSSI